MFGVSFATPVFLYGLAAIAIPIVIHLLFKARKQTVVFSSVQFILQSLVRKSSRIRFKELLLLLLRIAMFALVVLAFAKPSRGSAAIPRRWGSLNLVIVLDDSYSMAYDEDVTKRFELARRAALEEIQKLETGDRVGIVGLRAGRGVPVRLTPNFKAAAGAVRGMEVSSEPGRLADGIRRAEALLKDSQAAHKRIVMISDFQRASWIGLEPAVGELPKGIAVTAIPTRHGRSANLAVADVRASGWGWTQGRRLELTARVANYGGRPARDVSVSLHMEGREVQGCRLDVGAGEIAEARFSCRPEGAEAVGWVEIGESDQLPADYRYFFHFALNRPLRVLCVDDEVAEVAYFQESHYLRTALDPSTKRRRGPGLFAPDLADPASLEGKSLAGYRVVCLVNVSGVSGPQADRLEEYVRGGGGLLIFLGDKAERTIYNYHLYRQGEGLLPCRLGEVRKALPTEFWHFGQFDRAHYVFQPFLDVRSADLSGPRFESVVAAGEVSPEGAGVLAWMDDGEPAILEKKLGRGRVLLFMSAADATWTNLPKKKVYLPLMHRMVRYLAGAEKPDAGESVRVGEPVYFGEDEIGPSGVVVFKARDGRETRLKAMKESTDGRWKFTGTETPGIYTATVPRRGFVVNLDTRESDLTAVRESVIEGLVRKHGPAAPDTELARAAARLELGRTAEAAPGPWRILLVGALVLMLFELLLANRVGA